MMKKKIFKSTLTVVMLAVAGYGGYKAYAKYASNEMTTSLLMQNVEALTQEETLNEYQQKCYNDGGNWDMATVLSASGFESVSCTIEGEITFNNVTIKGSYVKGGTYRMPWAVYKCESSSENCCIKQGLYTGETKLA